MDPAEFDPQALPGEEEQRRNMTPVTIPYFLYEAMARSYYGSMPNADRPQAVWQSEPSPDMTAFHLAEDVPSNWIPGGFAAQKHKKKDNEGPTATT